VWKSQLRLDHSRLYIRAHEEFEVDAEISPKVSPKVKLSPPVTSTCAHPRRREFGNLRHGNIATRASGAIAKGQQRNCSEGKDYSPQKRQKEAPTSSNGEDRMEFEAMQTGIGDGPSSGALTGTLALQNGLKVNRQLNSLQTILRAWQPMSSPNLPTISAAKR